MNDVHKLTSSDEWIKLNPKQRMELVDKVRSEVRSVRKQERAERDRLKQLAKATKPKKTRVKKSRLSKPKLASTPSVTSKAFLESFEWRRLRMEALKKYTPRCMCCGATPKDGAVMNVDHIKPRKLFPHLALDINNLQILCHECNHGKGNWDQTDWR